MSLTKSARQYQLVARRVEPVERGLDRGVRHRRGAVQQWLGDGVEQGSHLPGRRLRIVPDAAPHDAADLAQVDLLRERRARRDGAEQEEGVQLAGRVREEIAVGGEDFGAEFDGPEGGAGDDRAHFVQPEQERGDDAEVAAATADRPVQVGVLVGARAYALPVRQDELGLQQVVDGQPALAGEVPDAAAESEASDARRGDDAARCGQAVRVGGAVDLAPDAAAADPYHAGVRVDLDVLERGEVEDYPVVARSEARSMVAAAAHRKR